MVAGAGQPVNLLFAHAGHWLVDLIPLLPVLALGVWLLVTGIRNRRRS
jgi:hypothetical protein